MFLKREFLSGAQPIYSAWCYVVCVSRVICVVRSIFRGFKDQYGWSFGIYVARESAWVWRRSISGKKTVKERCESFSVIHHRFPPDLKKKVNTLFYIRGTHKKLLEILRGGWSCPATFSIISSCAAAAQLVFLLLRVTGIRDCLTSVPEVIEQKR